MTFLWFRDSKNRTLMVHYNYLFCLTDMSCFANGKILQNFEYVVIVVILIF